MPVPVPETSPSPSPNPLDAALPRSVQLSAAWSWRLLLIAAATAAGLWLLAFFKVIAVSVTVALLLSVLLAPVARWLRRRVRFSRVAASATSVVGLLVVVGGLLTLAGSSIANGFADLADQASAGIDTLVSWLSTGPLQISAEQIEVYRDQISTSVSDNASSLLSGALSVTTTLGHVGAGALITLFCTLFFLIDGRQIWSWLIGLLPKSARERTHEAGRRGLVALGAYTRTQILVALVDAVGIGIGAAILQVPLALPLATLVFLGSFIPIVGALVSGSVAVLVALVAHGPVIALAMFAVVLLVQQIEGHLLQPLLMGHAVSLHPVAVLLAVAAGTLAAGIVGALFAVPIAAVVNTVLLYLNGHDKYPELGTDPFVPTRSVA
ncbi:AI-2E family transporter [Pengzhenrongella frigida]|uniref:AI-2E family transporter n=1 Tax=Pengzhenrongella frigida TaxID=1259133 RepID=A0A4Q5N1V7_9MICO|nr:AI-2E family transporter [Cellulomonas sp. HLT2-17]RYV50527.1 AI-2E family transporter [Cellulomonas sp. HLT2-17]